MISNILQRQLTVGGGGQAPIVLDEDLGTWSFDMTAASDTVGVSDATGIGTAGYYPTGNFGVGSARSNSNYFTPEWYVVPKGGALPLERFRDGTFSVTIEFWTYSNGGITRNYCRSSDGNFYFQASTLRAITLMIGNGSGGTHYFWNNYTYATPGHNVWTHTALVFDGPDQEVRLYHDGVWCDTQAMPVDTAYNFPDITYFLLGTADKFVDEFRFSGVERYTGETTYEVPQYPFGTTPPGTAPASSTTRYLYHMQDSIEESSRDAGDLANSFTTWNYGDGKFGRTIVPYSGYSVVRYTTDSTCWSLMPTLGLTIEFWAMKPDAAASESVCLTQNAGNYPLTLVPSPGGLTVTATTSAGQICNTQIGNMYDNVWHHWAFVWDNTSQTFNVFLDGERKFQADISGQTLTAQGYIRFGNPTTIFDEMRLSQEAVYTDNFTPPTTEFSPRSAPDVSVYFSFNDTFQGIVNEQIAYAQPTNGLIAQSASGKFTGDSTTDTALKGAAGVDNTASVVIPLTTPFPLADFPSVPCTIEFWASYQTSYTGGPILTGSGVGDDPGATPDLNFIFGPNPEMQLRYANGSLLTWDGTGATTTASANTFYHQALVFDNVATEIRWYFDGNLIATADWDGTSTFNDIDFLFTGMAEKLVIDDLLVSGRIKYSGATNAIPTVPLAFPEYGQNYSGITESNGTFEDIPNVVPIAAWYTADATTLWTTTAKTTNPNNGDYVTVWSDSLGLGPDVTCGDSTTTIFYSDASDLAGTNGHPCVDWINSTSIFTDLAGAWTTLDTFTLFVVFQKDIGGGFRSFMELNNSFPQGDLLLDRLGVLWKPVSTYTTLVADLSDPTNLVSVTDATQSGGSFLKARNEHAQSEDGAVFNQMQFGQSHGAQWRGRLLDLLIFEGELHPNDYRLVEEYFATKYGTDVGTPVGWKTPDVINDPLFFWNDEFNWTNVLYQLKFNPFVSNLWYSRYNDSTVSNGDLVIDWGYDVYSAWQVDATTNFEFEYDVYIPNKDNGLADSNNDFYLANVLSGVGFTEFLSVGWYNPETWLSFYLPGAADGTGGTDATAVGWYAYGGQRSSKFPSLYFGDSDDFQIKCRTGRRNGGEFYHQVNHDSSGWVDVYTWQDKTYPFQPQLTAYASDDAYDGVQIDYWRCTVEPASYTQNYGLQPPPPDPNTVGLWRFEDNLGGTVGNNWVQGSIAPSYVGGISGRSAKLASSTPHYVNVPASGSDWTIEFWLNALTSTSAETILQGMDGTNGTGNVCWYLQYDPGGNTYWFIYDSNGDFPPGGHIISGSTPAHGSGWHHLTYSVQGLSVKCWLDGVLKGEKTLPGGTTARSFQSITGPSASSGNTFIDELRYSNVARYQGTSIVVPTPPIS